MRLVVDALSVRFPTGPVLQGVSFSLQEGEVIGLTGTSGAGKSLIAEALAGALPRDAQLSGRITFEGQESPCRIALAPQRLDALDPLARIGPQIKRFARLAGAGVDVARALSDVGLPAEVARAYPHELSGGMARRTLLATTLATGAGWIVADEPTVGLDDHAADAIIALLGDLATHGRGVIVISHDVIRLARIATRILVLREGAVVETAPAAAFAGNGAALNHPFSRALWLAQPGQGEQC